MKQLADIINILHVEDDENHAFLVRKSLKNSGHRFNIDTVETLEEAFSLAGGKKFDFVLSDMYLPDGKSADRIEDFAKICDCPIIVMSSSSEMSDTEQAVSNGATDYIIKSPESFKLLPEMLRKAIVMWRLEKNREAMAKALAEEKEKFEKIATSAGEAVILLDAAGKILLWNSSAEKLFGYEEREALGENLFSLLCMGEESCPMRSHIIKSSETDGESASIPVEFSAVCKNGEKSIVECASSTIRLKGENQHLLIARDITYRITHENKLKSANIALEEDVKLMTQDLVEANQKLHEEIQRRKTTEEILRKNEHFLKEAQRIAHVGNWIWNIKTNDLYWSDEIFRIWGYSPQEFEPTYETFLASIHPEDRNAVTEAVNNALYQKREYAIDHRIIRDNEDIRYIHETGEVEYDEDGNPSRMIGTVHDLTALRKSEERIQYLAYHDELTGLPNRRLFVERLQMVMDGCKSGDECLAVIFMDLDNFKNINDVYGHDEGDDLVRQLARRMTGAYLNVDMIARNSGDDFLFMVTGKGKVGFESYKVVERIIFEMSKPFDVQGRDIFMSATMGISIYPTDGESPEILLQNSEMAMYKAKKESKSSYRMYSPNMNEEVRRRLLVESRLRNALKNNEFKVYYQPKINIGTGVIDGAEALIRWFAGDDVFYPVEFIPIAEDTGLINEIGEWVLREACGQTASLHKKGFPQLTIAVNLSGKQFFQKTIHNTVDRIVNETEINPEKLTLEITENTAMSEVEDAIASMKKFTELGIKLSIDDFGTGYSSLSYLKRFPIKELKIDRSFVSEIPHNKDDAAISNAILSLSKNLGLETVAEGVETVEQLNFMKEHGCERAQGYLFSKPVPFDVYCDLLNAGPFITQ